MVLKEAARRIFMNAVEAADPYLCIKNTVELDGDTIIIGEEELTAEHLLSRLRTRQAHRESWRCWIFREKIGY